MGYVRVRCRIRNPASGQTKELELLADSGSWYVAFPVGVADSLGLRTVGREKVTLADGNEREVDLVLIVISILDRETHALAAIIDAPEPILGTSVMELLGLVIDPKDGEVRPRGPRASYMLHGKWFQTLVGSEQ